MTASLRRGDEAPWWWPYAFFGLSGLSLVLGGVLLFVADLPDAFEEILPQIFLNLGVSIFAVTAVQLIWRITGGDPMFKALTRLRQTVRLISDLDATGLQSAASNRGEAWNASVDEWRDRLRNATEIDLMGSNLQRQVSGDRLIIEAIREAVRDNLCRVRVLTLCPADRGQDGQVKMHPLADQRIREEKLAGAAGAQRRIEGALERTWSEFKKLQQDFDTDAERQSCIQLRWSDETNIYVNLIRADDRIWMSPYMASVTGSNTAAFQVEGRHAGLFGTFSREFEYMWEHGVESAALREEADSA